MLKTIGNACRHIRKVAANKLSKHPTAAPSPVLISKTPARRPPLQVLSPRVEALRQRAHQLLSGHDYPHLTTERFQLREQIEGDLKNSAQAKINPLSGADLRFLQECLDTMRAFDNFFLRSYAVSEDLPLHEQLLPSHREKLMSALQQAFASNSAEQRVTLASIMEPRALEWAGIRLSRPEAIVVEQGPCGSQSLLTIDEVIALADYLHPHTMQFQVMNGGARLSRFWGVDGIECATARLSSAYRSALSKLARNESFIDRRGTYYKGICLGSPVFANDRETMDFLAQRSGIVFPPHPLSMTRQRSASFARQANRAEDAEVVIHVPNAIDVGLFHGKLGKALEEVILPAMPLRVVGAGDETRFGRRIRTYVLGAVDDPSSAWLLRPRAAGLPRARSPEAN